MVTEMVLGGEMSYVADIILVTAIEDGQNDESEHPNVDLLNNYLNDVYKRILVKVDDYAGGNKAIQCDVFMAAINYLDIPAFTGVYEGIKWERPECVQLMIKNENDDLFTVIKDKP